MKRAIGLFGLTLLVAVLALQDIEAAQAPSRRTQRAWGRAIIQSKIAGHAPRHTRTMPGTRATVPHVRVR